jgi:hypothetical protein
VSNTLSEDKAANYHSRTTIRLYVLALILKVSLESILIEDFLMILKDPQMNSYVGISGKLFSSI